MSVVRETFFWDGTEEDYGEREWEIVIGSFMRNGVAIEDDGFMGLKPSVNSAGTGVVLSPGSALSGFHWVHLETAKAYTPSKKNMKYFVVARTVWADRKTSIFLKEGTESAYPALQKDFGTVYEVQIASFEVGSDAKIRNLVDTRTDTTVCGAIRARDSSEMDEYFINLRSSMDDWMSEVMGTTARRQTYVQTAEPTGMVDGALWMTPDFRTVKMYSGGTSGWQVVHDEKKGMRFKLRNDLVTQNGITDFGPIDLLAEGSQEEGDYGQNMSNGVKILKAGWYMCSANIHISDSPHLTGAYQMRLVVANRVVDGTQYTIGENYVTTNTISAPKQYLATGNPSGVVYLKAGEIVAIHLIPPKTTGLYRVSSAQTHMDIYPLRLD